MSETAQMPVKDQLLNAALDHVVFDGWSKATFDLAVADTGIDPVIANAICPRGAVDLAVAYHQAGDAAMAAAWDAAETENLKIREKVTLAVRLRLQAAKDREAVRRGTILFALPAYATEGAKLIWGTADAIWTLLGDTSQDFNWYTKRATLSAVYGSTVLFWLGDDSPDSQATWDFLDRRIENVMQFEKTKAQVQGNKLLSSLFAGPAKVLDQIKAPQDRSHFPGRWTR